MNIIISPIDKIQFQDIVLFCNEQIEEGTRVEYKREFPKNKNIAKKIASFANTFGGVLLIGVDENDRKPCLPLIGFDFIDGLEEKITSICLQNINPPVIPEVGIYRNDEDESKCVVLVRIAESDQTPHRVENDTEIYVRANSQSEPIKATWEQVEWLVNRRKLAVANRIRLLERANNRFNAFSHKIRSKAFRNTYVIPLFPNRILLNLKDFREIIAKRALNIFNQNFPYNIRDSITQNESQIFSSAAKDEASILRSVKYVEINQFGLIWNKEDLWENYEHGSENQIQPHFVMQQLYFTFAFAIKFYEELGFWGSLEIGHNMEGIKGNILSIYKSDYDRKPNEGKSKFDNSFRLSKTYTTIELKNKFDDIIFGFFRNFLWSCGAPAEVENTKFAEDNLKGLKSNYSFGI